MKFDSLIFDLDGTLWDTCDTCAIAWNSVLQKHAIPFREITGDDVRGVTGRPHEECIRTVFSELPDETVQLLIESTIIEDNHMVSEMGGMLYDGVREGLTDLSRYYQLFIVSNCQSGYIETFLRWSNFQDLFRDSECWGNTQKSKSHNTASLIRRNDLKSPLFIGDTSGDMGAANATGIPFAFVSYGFGEVSNSDYRFDSFSDMAKWLVDSTR